MPTGRPHGVMYVGDWIRHMHGCTEVELRRIAEAKRRPVEMRAAAMALLATMEQGYTKAGRRLAADDLDRLLDRTEGKPLQRVEVDNLSGSSREELVARLKTLMASSPEVKKIAAEVFHVEPTKMLEAPVIVAEAR